MQFGIISMSAAAQNFLKEASHILQEESQLLSYRLMPESLRLGSETACKPIHFATGLEFVGA